MNCRKVNQLLSAYMDGELPGVEHRQVFEHLARCPECDRAHRQLLSVKRMLSGLKSREPHTRAPERILAYIALEEARRPSRWSKARLERAAAQIGDWWREQGGSPRTLAALSGAFALALLLTRGNLPARFASALSKPHNGSIRFDRVADETAGLPVVARPLDAYTSNLRPLRPYRAAAPMRVARLPWEPSAASQSVPNLSVSGDPVTFWRMK